MKDIFSLGHQVSLHFDITYYDLEDDIELLNKYLLREKRILEEVVEQDIRVFAFHTTTPLAVSCTNWRYGNIINANATYFREELGYCSDSNGYWRFRRFEDVLSEAKDKRLHILTHPAWWQEAVMFPKERIWWCIEGRAKKNKEFYLDHQKRFGRENIDRK